MLRVMAVLRTAFLLFIVVYTLWTTEFAIGGGVAMVTPEAMRRATRTVWIAIGWIAFDTVVGWLMSSWQRARAARAEAMAAAAAARAASGDAGAGRP